MIGLRLAIIGLGGFLVIDVAYSKLRSRLRREGERNQTARIVEARRQK